MKTVLIIEPDENLRSILADWFEVQGFTAITSNDGEEGIQFAQSYAPNLILCNDKLSPTSSTDVFYQLRANLNTSHIPFFFLTCTASLEQSLQALGADGIILKGTDITRELRKALTRLEAKP